MIDRRILNLIREIVQREDVGMRVFGIEALICGLVADARSDGYLEGYEDGLADAEGGDLL